jgi:hypothetical protein
MQQNPPTLNIPQSYLNGTTTIAGLSNRSSSSGLLYPNGTSVTDPALTNPSGALSGASTTAGSGTTTGGTGGTGTSGNQTLLNTQIDQAKALTGQNIGQGANTQRASADNFLQALQQGQLGINQDRTLTQYNKLTSVNDLINSIRNGINSGGVALGNANALNSSAAEGLARAYNAYGTQAQNSIEGQSNLASLQDDQKETALQATGGQYRAQLAATRQNILDNIGNDIYSRLNVLNAQAAQQGLSPIDVAGEKQKIVADAQAKLQGVDDYFASMLDPNNNAQMHNTNNTEASDQAYGAYTQGIVPQNAGLYSYDRTPVNSETAGGATSAGSTAAPITSLPLFTKRTA